MEGSYSEPVDEGQPLLDNDGNPIQVPQDTMQTFKGVRLEHGRVMCSMHGEPFRMEWPKGYPTFAVKGLALMDEKDWQDIVKVLMDAGRTYTVAVEEALDIRPICCRIPGDKLLELYLACGLGRPGKCQLCGKQAMGTTHQTRDIKYRHVCLHCVAHPTKVTRRQRYG